MKVAFDVAQTCSPKAGCGWFADRLARALADVAPEDSFILLHHFGTWLNPRTRSGTHLNRPNVSEPLAAYSVRTARRLWTEVAAGRATLPGAPDVVHANCFQAPMAGGARLVYTVHDVSFWMHPEFTTEANRLACQQGMLDAVQRARGLVFISEHTRQEFERLFPGLAERRNLCTTVALLASRFPTVSGQIPRPPDGKWLAVGSLEPRKNYDALLDAMDLYWQTSTVRRPLTIVGGRGWNSDGLRARIRKLAKAGLVRHEGYVAESRLVRLYRESFALLFASHYEGFGLPLVEAMSQGCPVISARNSSLPEVGGDAVLWCEPANATQLARQMLALENSPELQAACSADGLTQARRFDWAKTARQVLDLYRQVGRTAGGLPSARSQPA
ncbi:MAG TPA: glycosyltransferase family 1 protein [Chthoniobacterales bacterium]